MNYCDTTLSTCRLVLWWFCTTLKSWLNVDDLAAISRLFVIIWITWHVPSIAVGLFELATVPMPTYIIISKRPFVGPRMLILTTVYSQDQKLSTFRPTIGNSTHGLKFTDVKSPIYSPLWKIKSVVLKILPR